MNGAECLVRTLLDEQVEVCFTNPGTSEMHFVAALDRVPGMRCVLGLFEGVVTGAADGYWRMARRPASTLLHLGPGLANGLANLHNARKARSGVLNIVGDHARAHLALDAPLTADIEGIARPMSHWVQSLVAPSAVEATARAAVQVATTPPGRIATLILPADCAWGEIELDAGGLAAARLPRLRPDPPDAALIDAAAQLLRGSEPVALLLGAEACHEEALVWAGRIAAATGCGLFIEFGVARLARGAGRVNATRLPYAGAAARAALAPYRNLICIGAPEPVSFFAYPDTPGRQVAPGTRILPMASPGHDLLAALEALADALSARRLAPVHVAPRATLACPEGALDLDGLGRVIAALLPEHAIVVDEAVSSGRGFAALTAEAAPHDWLSSTGGSIGFGLPAALGAALAAPDRRVLCLEGDGSALYTVQSLWTLAREGLPVTVLIFANRAYRILQGEYAGVGAGRPGPRAQDLFSLERPALDWVSIARGLGVDARQVSDLGALAAALRHGFAANGPFLIEALL